MEEIGSPSPASSPLILNRGSLLKTQPKHEDNQEALFRLDDIRYLIRNVQERDEEITSLKKVLNELNMKVQVMEKLLLETSGTIGLKRTHRDLLELSLQENNHDPKLVPVTVESPPMTSRKHFRPSPSIAPKHVAIACQYCTNSKANRSCPLCKDVFYCSVECQRFDWNKQHKEKCKPKSALVLDRLKAHTYLPLETLASDVLFSIFSYLEDRHLCSLNQVSRFFHTAVDNERFWKRRFLDVYGVDKKELGYKPRNWKQLYISHTVLSWDPYHKCDEIILSNFNKTASHSVDTNWESIQLRKGISKGRAYYEVETQGRLTVGIATRDFPFNAAKNIGGENIIAFGYASNGNYARPNERWKVQVAERWQEKERLGILVDLEANVITFWRGGVKQNETLVIEKRYRGLKWFLTATLFDDPNTKITILEKTEPPEESPREGEKMSDDNS
jgi:hypothetical protein